MSTASVLHTQQGREIAYHQLRGQGPALMFCGGFRSDMDGTKAVHLEAWAKAREQAFMRFDYSGHGQSSGNFTDGSIGDWYEDAAAVLAHLTSPVVLVGSSMGGWISLLLARSFPQKVAGLVGIAAAPDFTADSMWDSLTPVQKAQLEETGQTEMPSDYGDPYILSTQLFKGSEGHLVLRSPLPLQCPTRFLQGTNDDAVSTEVALRLLSHASCGNMQLTLIDGADHRFSDKTCLAAIERAVEDVLDLY